MNKDLTIHPDPFQAIDSLLRKRVTKHRKRFQVSFVILIEVVILNEIYVLGYQLKMLHFEDFLWTTYCLQQHLRNVSSAILDAGKYSQNDVACFHEEKVNESYSSKDELHSSILIVQILAYLSYVARFIDPSFIMQELISINLQVIFTSRLLS